MKQTAFVAFWRALDTELVALRLFAATAGEALQAFRCGLAPVIAARSIGFGRLGA